MAPQQVSVTRPAEDSEPGPSRLYDLPVEIYKDIFERAFPHVPDLKIIDTSAYDYWDRIERKRNRDNPVIVPRNAPKVSEWLVSKRFFNDAARTWFFAQTLSHRLQAMRPNNPADEPQWARTSVRSADPTFYSVTMSTYMLYNGCRLYHKYATYASVPCSMVMKLHSCLALKHVTIEVQELDFDLEPRYGWEDDLTENEITRIYQNTGLTKLKGYETLIVEIPTHEKVHWHYVGTPRQQQILMSNVEKLQTMARKKASKPNVEMHPIDTSEAVRVQLLNKDSKVFTHPKPAVLPYLGLIAVIGIMCMLPFFLWTVLSDPSAQRQDLSIRGTIRHAS